MVTVKPDDGDLSPIAFYLDRGSGVPTYLQFVHQVDYALRLGFLREGDQLPRIKDVTRTLAVNPDTVMKAYRELELRGVAAGRPGVGTFITQAPEIAGLKQMAALQKKLAGLATPTTGTATVLGTAPGSPQARAAGRPGPAAPPPASPS